MGMINEEEKKKNQEEKYDPNNNEEDPLHSRITGRKMYQCCAFRSLYSLALFTSILTGIFGFLRFLLLTLYYMHSNTPGYVIMLGAIPLMFSVLSSTFSAFICNYTAPFSGQSPFIDQKRVITSVEPPNENDAQYLYSPKTSRIICWIFIFLLFILLIALSFPIASHDACITRCDLLSYSTASKNICYQNKTQVYCEFKCTYFDDYSSRSYTQGSCK